MRQRVKPWTRWGTRISFASTGSGTVELPATGFDNASGFTVTALGSGFEHGERIRIHRSAGGFGSGPSKVLDDRVSNHYSGLTEGQRIPTTSSFPYSDNTPLGEGEVQFSQLNLRHDRQTANYKWDGAGTLEWPKLFGADEAPSTQLTMYGRMWIRRVTTGTGTGNESSKYFRIWDSSEGVGTRISYGSLNLTVFNGQGLDDGSEGAGLMPVGGWHLLEIYVESNVQVRTWKDGAATGFYTGTFKNTTQSARGFNFKVVGWDIGGNSPTYAQWHMGDIYLADSRARVVITNNATWSSVTTGQETQIPVSWEDDEIEFDLNQGQFDDLSGKHLIVLTSSNTPLYAGSFA